MTRLALQFSELPIASVLWAAAVEAHPLPKLAEFQAVAEKLAGRFNLFRDVWRQDPKAFLYGSTTRDFLFWVREQYGPAKNA